MQTRTGSNEFGIRKVNWRGLDTVHSTKSYRTNDHAVKTDVSCSANRLAAIASLQFLCGRHTPVDRRKHLKKKRLWYCTVPQKRP